jgi:hypothetical protein
MHYDVSVCVAVVRMLCVQCHLEIKATGLKCWEGQLTRIVYSPYCNNSFVAVVLRSSLSVPVSVMTLFYVVLCRKLVPNVKCTGWSRLLYEDWSLKYHSASSFLGVATAIPPPPPTQFDVFVLTTVMVMPLRVCAANKRAPKSHDIHKPFNRCTRCKLTRISRLAGMRADVSCKSQLASEYYLSNFPRQFLSLRTVVFTWCDLHETSARACTRGLIVSLEICFKLARGRYLWALLFTDFSG